MRKPLWTNVALKLRAICLTGLFVFCSFALAKANPSSEKVLCRPELSSSRRAELAGHLRKITGWTNLYFDAKGALRLDSSAPQGGSAAARKLLKDAVVGRTLIILEDASNRQDLAFGRVTKARWKRGAADDPPVFIIQMDFADFSRVIGDRAALEAFNVGWGVLHEMAHAVNDSEDSKGEGEAGECEGLINLMRRECGLAERADYYFSFLPGRRDDAFATKFVRLGFELKISETKKKRYWLVWDSRLVGGLDEQTVASAHRSILP